MRRSGQAALFVGLAAVVLAWVGYVSAAEQQKRPGTKKVPQIVNVPRETRSPDVVGTVIYDNNIPVSRDGTLNQPIGNNVNDHPAMHSIMSVSYKLAGCYVTPYPGALVHIHDINPTLMTAMQLIQFSGMAGPGNNCNAAALYSGVLPVPLLNQTGPFFAGIHNTNFGGCNGMTGIGGTCEGVALTAGTMDPGLGFHGVRVNGIMYTALVPAKNAIFRVTGDNLPVELMGFGVK